MGKSVFKGMPSSKYKVNQSFTIDRDVVDFLNANYYGRKATVVNYMLRKLMEAKQKGHNEIKFTFTDQ